MDDILELIGSILETVIDGSKMDYRVKKWLKTILYGILFAIPVGVFALMAISDYRKGNVEEANLSGGFALVMAIAFLIGIIYIYKKE